MYVGYIILQGAFQCQCFLHYNYLTQTLGCGRVFERGSLALKRSWAQKRTLNSARESQLACTKQQLREGSAVASTYKYGTHTRATFDKPE
jgi:hypothetical protein